MLNALVDSQPSRALIVAAGSVVAYIGLAILIYWAYFTIGDSIYDRSLREGVGTVQVVFYVALAAHLVATLGAHMGLTSWTRAPRFPTLLLSALIVGAMVPFTLGAMTGLNLDHYGVEFPLPGQGYR